jgi:hypothetical protein
MVASWIKIVESFPAKLIKIHGKIERSINSQNFLTQIHQIFAWNRIAAESYLHKFLLEFIAHCIVSHLNTNPESMWTMAYEACLNVR